MPFKKGHKKIPGSGKKKGDKEKKTIEREVALELYQQGILNELKPLMNAHFAIAKGTQIVLAREWVYDKKKRKKVRGGRFVRVTDEFEVEELLNSKEIEGKDYYVIFTQDPNPKALEDLMSRVFGKSKETVELEAKRPIIIQVVSEEAEKARKRIAARKKRA